MASTCDIQTCNAPRFTPQLLDLASLIIFQNMQTKAVGFNWKMVCLGFAKWLAMTGLEPAHYATGLEPAMFRSEV